MDEEINPNRLNPADDIPIVARPMDKGGRPKGSTNLHSKHPSGIAHRLKAAGVDWVVDLARALQANDAARIALWMRMLPYLVVTQGHRQLKKRKGRASKAALEALKELEEQ